MRTRVARSDWCASRIVVSVKSSFFCARTHFATASGPSARSRSRVPRGRAALASILRDPRLAQLGRLERPRDALGAVDRHLAEELEELRAAVLLLRDLQQLGVGLDEGGVALPREEVGVDHHVLEERDVGLHAADAELLQARCMTCAAALRSSPQVVTFTSSES